jgi:hypothetical protein
VASHLGEVAAGGEQPHARRPLVGQQVRVHAPQAAHDGRLQQAPLRRIPAGRHVVVATGTAYKRCVLVTELVCSIALI